MSTRMLSSKTRPNNKPTAKADEKRSKEINKQLMDKEQYLYPGRIEKLDKVDQFNYGIGPYLKGHFIRSNVDEDTNLQIRKDLLSTGKSGASGAGETPFGVLSADERVIQTIKTKKAEEESFKKLQLASLLIDSKNPATQEVAFALFPQLQEVPEQAHLERVAIQEALRVLLRDGRMMGPEDNDLVFGLLHPDVKIPIGPLWDPDSVYINLAAARLGVLSFAEQQQALQRGLFSPRNWTGGVLTGQKGAAYDKNDINTHIKIMIVRRLYPAVRDKTEDEIIEILVDMFSTGSGNAFDKDSLPLWKPMAPDPTYYAF